MRNLPSLCLLVLLLAAVGCNNQSPKAIRVQGMEINGYVFDYDLSSPSSIQADSRDVHIRTGTKQIDVVDGKLKVDGVLYGTVKSKDRISFEGDKISVNGQAREKG